MSGNARTQAGPAPAGHLLAGPWGHVTSRFVALGHDFRVRTTEAALGVFLDQAFSALARPGAAAVTYSIVETAGTGVEARHAFYRDEQRLISSDRPSQVLEYLVWRVNQEVARTPDALLVHAAAAEREGVGVVLPAPMEAGKTTLVAGLVRAGWRYLTDETVAIDDRTGLIQPYPKPLSVDRGSWTVLAELAPEVGPRVAPYLKDQWLVAPDAIRPHAVGGPVAPSLIVAHHYRAGAETRLEPAGPAEIVALMAEQTFNFRVAAGTNLDRLAAVVAGARCYRLTVGDLDLACELITGLLHPAGGR